MSKFETWERWREGESGMPIMGLVRAMSLTFDFQERSTPFDRLEVIARWPVYLPVSNVVHYLEQEGSAALPRAIEFFNEMDMTRRREVDELFDYLAHPRTDGEEIWL